MLVPTRKNRLAADCETTSSRSWYVVELPAGALLLLTMTVGITETTSMLSQLTPSRSVAKMTFVRSFRFAWSFLGILKASASKFATAIVTLRVTAAVCGPVGDGDGAGVGEVGCELGRDEG